MNHSPGIEILPPLQARFNLHQCYIPSLPPPPAPATIAPQTPQPIAQTHPFPPHTTSPPLPALQQYMISEYRTTITSETNPEIIDHSHGPDAFVRYDITKIVRTPLPSGPRVGQERTQLQRLSVSPPVDWKYAQHYTQISASGTGRQKQEQSPAQRLGTLLPALQPWLVGMPATQETVAAAMAAPGLMVAAAEQTRAEAQQQRQEQVVGKKRKRKDGSVKRRALEVEKDETEEEHSTNTFDRIKPMKAPRGRRIRTDRAVSEVNTIRGEESARSFRVDATFTAPVAVEHNRPTGEKGLYVFGGSEMSAGTGGSWEDRLLIISVDC